MTNEDNKSVLGDDPLKWMKDQGEVGEAKPDEVNPEPDGVEINRVVEEPPVLETPEFPVIEDLTIRSIVSWYNHFKNLLGEQDSISLDLGSLKRIDTSGIQLLLVFQTWCKEKGVKLEWVSPSEEIEQISELLAVNEELRIELGEGS